MPNLVYVRSAGACPRIGEIVAPPVSIFTALHGMQTRSIDENFVRPFVRLSNACIVTKKEDLSSFLYHAKDSLTKFSEKKNGS